MLTGLSLFLAAMLGLLPYTSSIKLPPIPSFWAEWIAVVLAFFWLASLRKPAVAEGLPRASPSTVSVPVVVLSFVALGATLLLQLLLQQPRFTGAPVLVLLALIPATLLSLAGARIRAAGETVRLLDIWAMAVLAALALNLITVLAERQGWHLYIYQFGFRRPPARAEGLIGQPNQLAVLAAMASVTAHYLWMRGRLPSIGHVLVGLVASIVIAASASRAGALIWLAGAALSGLALREHPSRMPGFKLLSIGVVLFLAAQVGWKQLDVGSAPATAVTVLRSDSIGRTELLRDSWELIKRHPLTGVGYGNFMGARWAELSGSLSESNANHAHNIVMQLAAELGLIGAGLILVPLAWALWRCLVVITRRNVRPEQFLAAAIPLLIGAYSLVEFPLWYTFFLLPFALMLGLVEQRDLKVRVTAAAPALRWAGFTVAAAVSALVAADYHRSEVIYTAMEFQQREQRVAAVTIPVQEASKVSTLSAFDVYASLMYSRALQPDGMFMQYKLGVTDRAMLGMTNQETVARKVAMLVVADELPAAHELVARTRRDPELERSTRDFLERLAPLHPRLSAFVKALPPLPTPAHGE